MQGVAMNANKPIIDLKKPDLFHLGLPRRSTE
jgi:hypothetical protein